jgi:hypothetical protein
VAIEAGIMRDIDAAEDEFAAADEAVDVVADAEEEHANQLLIADVRLLIF